MAAQIQSAANKVELAALGRSAQKEDWVKDLALHLGVLFLGTSEGDLIKLTGERMRVRAAYARPCLDELRRKMDSRPEGFLTEIKNVRDMLDRCSTINFNESTPTAQVFYSHLECETESILSHQKSLDEEWKEYQAFLDARNDTAENIPRAVRAMCREMGSARTTMAAELKGMFNRLFSVTSEIPPVVHLTYAWVALQNADSSEELFTNLATASRCLIPTLSSHFCCRLLADLYAREGNPTRALDWSKRSLEHLSTCEANMETALLAAELHEPTIAKPFIEAALVLRPSSVVAILSDDRCLNLGEELLDTLVRVQMRMRRDGRQYIVAWALAAKEMGDLQRVLGTDLTLPHELMEAHKTIEPRLAEADILTSGALIRYCEQSKLNLYQTAKSSTEREFDRKRDALTAARLNIDALGVGRENQIQIAKQEQAHRIRNAHSQLQSVTAKSKHIEKQSMLWFGSGCALFALFVLTKGVLGLSNSVADISSGFGLFFLAVAGIPILLSIGIQIYHGLARAAVETMVKEKIVDANRRMNQAELEANDHHRDQLALGRKTLAETEAQLRKIETALRTLKPEERDAELVSPRLRAA